VDASMKMSPASSAVNAEGRNVESCNFALTPCARRVVTAWNMRRCSGHCKRSLVSCTSSSTASRGYRSLKMAMLTNRKRVIL
jgi:hypothetical protein